MILGSVDFLGKANPMSNSPTKQECTRWFLEEVYPHEPSLRSFLHRSLPSSADVDDVVQDTYTRLLHARERNSIRSTKPLLWAIARNVVHDFFRRQRIARLESITENNSLSVLEDGLNLMESLCQQDEYALLAEAISTLPARCREVILLRKIKGRPQREIAHLLGISENTVESLSVKGTRRVAAYLRALAARH